MQKKLSLISLLLIGLVGCNSGSQANSSAYQIVVDSGSSGSRVYVYNKNTTESGIVITQLYSKKSSTPLASFATNPNSAGTSITPLLESAISYLTSSESNLSLASVSTSVLGTAGMRLIGESQQAAIYANLTESITSLGLKTGEVATISGQYEGIYSWLDVNYLQNNFATNSSTTTGIFEVGGASAQVAFATDAPSDQNVKAIKVHNHNYNVYSTSFLGLGQDYARGSLNNMDAHNQCYPSGYTYTGTNDPYFSNNSLTINGTFASYQPCSTLADQVIESYPNIDKIDTISNFYTQKFIGVSSVYYALSFWNIESDISALESNIQTTCSQNYSQLQQQYPKAFNLQNQCVNSVLINQMMNSHLKFKADQLTAVPSINNTDLSYTLGFVLINN
ncbi:MAG: hypothetical protein RLZZ293_480 [Pseudomonadota bacterium]|jgi:apyrase